MEMYCGKTNENEYKDFFKSTLQVKMCGHVTADIVKVQIVVVKDGDGTHYGYQDNNTGRIMYIFRDKRLVDMCSPDGFKSNIESGEGSIVKISIEEI